MTAHVRVEFTPEFKRNLRALARRYRSIHSDVQPIIERIQVGEFLGERIPGTRYVVFKVRVQNTDIQKGKSAGYRLIYQAKQPTLAVLVTMYSKVEQSDILPERIRRILDEETGSPT